MKERLDNILYNVRTIEKCITDMEEDVQDDPREVIEPALARNLMNWVVELIEDLGDGKPNDAFEADYIDGIKDKLWRLHDYLRHDTEYEVRSSWWYFMRSSIQKGPKDNDQ